MIEYSSVWRFLCDLGTPLGVSEKKLCNRYYAAMTLWMLEVKIYQHKQLYYHYVEFYDVLEALVKKTIYKKQTLYKIFNNSSKDALVDGLQDLWNEKSKLTMEEQTSLGKIEALTFYYNAKKAKEAQSLYTLIKAQLPMLVWITLRITRTLRLKVKQRKGMAEGTASPKSECQSFFVNSRSDSAKIDESRLRIGRTSLEPAAAPSPTKLPRTPPKSPLNRSISKAKSKNRIVASPRNLLRSAVDIHKPTYRFSCQLAPLPEERPQEIVIDTVNLDLERKEAKRKLKTELSGAQLERYREDVPQIIVMDEPQSHRLAKRLVEVKKPYKIQKVNIRQCTEALNVQSLLHSIGCAGKKPKREEESHSPERLDKSDIPLRFATQEDEQAANVRKENRYPRIQVSRPTTAPRGTLISRLQSKAQPYHNAKVDLTREQHNTENVCMTDMAYSETRLKSGEDANNN